jgi:hypothetical protein
VKILDRTHPAINPIPRRPRTMGDLLDLFVSAVSANDYEVEAGSIDTQGVTIADSRNGLLYRVEVTEDGMLDDAEWQQRSSANYEHFLRQQEARRRIEEDGDDCRRSAFLGEDPAGFNGQESPDDVEF